MYINFDYLEEKGYSLYMFLALVAIQQQNVMVIKKYSDLIPSLEEKGLVQYIQGKGKTEELIRISKTGKAFLLQVSTYGYNDNIGRLAKKLQEKYVEYGVDEKRLGKLQTIVERIVWFLSDTPFSLADIYNHIEEYLNSTSPEYVMNLESLFWKAPHQKEVKPSLKNSHLFDYICKAKGLDILKVIEPTSKAKAGFKWLSGVVNHQIPKGLPDHLYFTGSYKGDVEAKNRIITNLLQFHV